jgi:hypothetical protein
VPVRDRMERGAPQNRMLSTVAGDRRFKSEGFVGTWPNGIHWTLGETRTIPANWPGGDTEPPPGLVLLEGADTKEG